jgi:putative MATE family efflux protein
MGDSRISGDLTRGRLFWRLVTFGIPLVLGMFFHSLFNLVDLIIVGRLGPYALGAVNQASLINFIPMLISTGVNNASIAVISRNFGMRNYRRANANALQSFLLLAMLAVVLGWPSYHWAKELNQLIGSKGAALPAATEYLEIMSLGLFTMFALMQVTAVLRAGGNARWPMILLIGANVLNVALTILMVHGWEAVGVPAMGVAGAAWSTVIARGLFALFGLYLITRPSSPVRLIWWRIRLRGKMLWNLTRIGIPSSLQFVVRVVAYGILLRLVTEFEDAEDMHNALAVGFRLDMLATFTGAGWGAAGAAMVGQSLGAGKLKRAERAGWMTTFLNVVMMGLIGFFFWLYAPALIIMFGDDPAVRSEYAGTVRLGVEYLRIATWGYVFAGIGVTLAQSLNGAGSTKTPLFLDFVGFLCIQAPVAAYIAFNHEEHDWDRTWLWWGVVATTGLVAAFYIIVWRRGHWKHKKIQ